MYKLLIIDDEIDRIDRCDIYNYILRDEFDYDMVCNKLNIIREKLRFNIYDCIILDNNLDKEATKEDVINLIEEYDLPIIIVSNTRSFDLYDIKRSGVINYISLKPYVYSKNLISSTNMEKSFKNYLKEIIDFFLQETAKSINRSIYMSRGYSNKTNDNKLIICHISDLQFGDKSANPNDLNNFFTKLYSYINDRPQLPDLIAITGDIVYSGAKSEFDLAQRTISEFIQKTYKTDSKKKILLVPGNHDIEYNYYLIDENKGNFEIKKDINAEYKKFISKIPKITDDSINNDVFLNTVTQIKISPNIFEKFEASPSYLYNFAMFAYSLTEDCNYWGEDFFVNKKECINKGFEIVGINNAYKYRQVDEGAKRYIYDINRIKNKIKNHSWKSIILGHATPKHLGYNQTCIDMDKRCNKNYENECAECGCQFWGINEMLFNNLKGILYLHGHGHYSNYSISKDKKMLFIGAGSPSGINKSEKTFNMIEIQDNTDSISLELIVNKSEAAGIKYYKTYKFEYTKSSNTWKERN